MGKYKGLTPARVKATGKYFSEKVDIISVYVKKGKKLGVVIVPFTKSGSLEKNNLVRAVGDCAYKTIKLTK